MASRTIVVFARLERLALEHRLAGFVEDVGHGGAGAEEEPQARVVEDLLHAGGELVLVGGEIEPRGVVAVTGLTPPSANMLLMPKWQVLSAMSSTPLWLKCASTLAKFSRAMVISLTHISRNAQNVAKMPCLPLRVAEAGRGGEVAALHDAAADEDFRMLLADVVQSAGAFQIVVEDAHRGDAVCSASCRRGCR